MFFEIFSLKISQARAAVKNGIALDTNTTLATVALNIAKTIPEAEAPSKNAPNKPTGPIPVTNPLNWERKIKAYAKNKPRLIPSER